jgi:hypothetical protein
LSSALAHAAAEKKGAAEEVPVFEPGKPRYDQATFFNRVPIMSPRGTRGAVNALLFHIPTYV